MNTILNTDSIAGAREFAKEELVRLEREAEERAEAARQQIPAGYRGLTLDDLSEAARGFVTTFKPENRLKTGAGFGVTIPPEVPVNTCDIVRRQGQRYLRKRGL